MLKVGLTGGLASGKSFVGRALADLGCLLIQADELGHQVIEQGGETYDAVIAHFRQADPGRRTARSTGGGWRRSCSPIPSSSPS